MFYSNEFVDGLAEKVSIDKDMYANIQARNAANMLKAKKSWYKLFGVYWWAVKDTLRKYVNSDAWYCGVQDDPLMKERASHGSEYRTMLAASYYMNEHRELTSACVWYDREGERHEYTLFDPDAGC